MNQVESGTFFFLIIFIFLFFLPSSFSLLLCLLLLTSSHTANYEPGRLRATVGCPPASELVQVTTNGKTQKLLLLPKISLQLLLYLEAPKAAPASHVNNSNVQLRAADSVNLQMAFSYCSDKY